MAKDEKGKLKSDFLAEEFKDEVAEEKARRENLDMKQIEELAARARKKGTLRE